MYTIPLFYFLFIFYNLFIMIHCKQKGYNLFLWLYMKYSRTICEIIHVHREMTFVSNCYFSFPHHSHPSFLYTIHPSSILAPLTLPIMYHYLLFKEIIRPLVFWDWLISLSMILSKFIHLPENAIILFLFMTE